MASSSSPLVPTPEWTIKNVVSAKLELYRAGGAILRLGISAKEINGPETREIEITLKVQTHLIPTLRALSQAMTILSSTSRTWFDLEQLRALIKNVVRCEAPVLASLSKYFSTMNKSVRYALLSEGIESHGQVFVLTSRDLGVALITPLEISEWTEPGEFSIKCGSTE